jgi:hypothetical protein
MDTNQLELGTQPEVSPAKALALLSAALGAALLGLATFDVDAARSAEKRQAKADRSAECIVAAAIFVGVSRPHGETPVH